MIQLSVLSVFHVSNVFESRVMSSRSTALLRSDNDRLELLDLHGPPLLDVWRDLLVFSNHTAQDSKGKNDHFPGSVKFRARMGGLR